MSPLIFEDNVAIEFVIDIVETTLRADLNDMLEVIEEEWVDHDQIRAISRGTDYHRITLEPITAGNFDAGSIPSLITDPDALESFPNVALVPEDIVPDPEDQRQDNRNVYMNGLSIHSLAKAPPDAGFTGGLVSDAVELAFRRAVRTAQAIDRVIRKDAKLSRVVQSVSNPQRVRVSEPFPFTPSATGVGEDWWWQAAGMQYAIKNYAV